MFPRFPLHRLLLETLRQPTVAARPVAIAFDSAGTAEQQMSYGELFARASSLSQVLQRATAHNDTVLSVDDGELRTPTVGALLRRGVDCLTVPVAISMANCTYVPVDELYPAARTQFVLRDTGCSTLVVDDALLESSVVQEFPGTVIPMSDGATVPADWQLDAALARSFTECNVGQLEQAAFIMHTSGSTGNPKGVAVSHRSMQALLDSFCKAVQLNGNNGSGVLMSTPAGFDISLVEIWATIQHGLTAIVPRHIEIAPWWFEGAVKACHDNDVGFVQGVPSVLQGLLDASIHLPRASVVSCGDVLTPQLAASLSERFARVYNGYGPTESHYCTSHLFDSQTDRASVPIGEALEHAKCVVVRPSSNSSDGATSDASVELADTIVDLRRGQQQLCAPGETGLLFIGGETVALGYINRDDGANERFFISADYGRLYASGDLVRVADDGRTLEYMGRRDQQLNAGGLRVEAGEIEAAMRSVDGVRDAVAVALDDGTLVASVTPSDVDPRNLALQVATQLPPYHVPTQYRILDALPTMPNKKVDRRALTAMGISGCVQVETHDPNQIACEK